MTDGDRGEADAVLVAQRLAVLAADTGLTVEHLRESWLTQTSDQIAAAVTALASGDCAEVALLVHSAAGTSGICGAGRLARDLSSVESLAAEGRADDARAALCAAEADFRRLILLLHGGVRQ